MTALNTFTHYILTPSIVKCTCMFVCFFCERGVGADIEPLLEMYIHALNQHRASMLGLLAIHNLA